MKSTEILDLFARFEAAASKYEGIECWSARELQTLLGYSKWENFAKVISKAKESCLNAGEKEADHFPDVFLDNYNSPIYENSITSDFQNPFRQWKIQFLHSATMGAEQ